MTAAINPIGIAEIFKSFFAVEKYQLYFPGQVRLHCQDPRQFQEQAGARSPIVRADELKTLKYFGVVMRTKQKARFRCIPKPRHKIHEFHLTTRCLIGESLFDYFPTRRLELLFDVSAR